MKKLKILFVLMLLLLSMIPVHAAPAGSGTLKIAFVSPRVGDISMMEEVWNNEIILQDYYSEIKLIEGVTYNVNLVSENLDDYDIIILDGLAILATQTLENTIENAKQNGAHVYVNGQDSIYIKTAIDEAYEINISTYLNFPGNQNYKNLLLFLAYLEMDDGAEKTQNINTHLSGADTRPLTPNIYGIYHPVKWDLDREFFETVDDYLEWYAKTDIIEKTHTYDPSIPTIGVIPSTSYNRIDRDKPLLDYFVNEIESQGYNVIVGTYVTANHDNNRKSFIDQGGNVKIDVAISVSRGGRFYGTAGRADDGVAELENLNVPVLTAVQLYSNVPREEWENSNVGLMPDQHYQLALAEMDGMIEPIVVAAKPMINGKTVDRNEPIDYQTDWMVQRAIGWANLATKDNSSKKIVIPYYAAEAGRANIGTDPDYFLDAPASILKILQAMDSNGYNVGSDIPTSGDIEAEKAFQKTLIEQMTQSGYNAGTWAPGQLEKLVENGNVELLPVEEYNTYFNTKITPSKQDEVNALWGTSPGNIMVYENATGKYFVIPVIKYGNVVLTPTPLRGRDQSADAMAHEKDYPPTHQALATYYFINEKYDADVMLPLWSNLATMPGKEAGLAADDWTALMIQDTPIIHVLPMDATGLTDRRRANMLIVNFMTPTLVQSGLYGELADLETHITTYENFPLTREETLKLIIEICENTGVSDGLNIDWNAAKQNENEANDAVEKLSKQLRRIKNSNIPYGDHILGVAPEGEELAAMISAMISYQTSIDTHLDAVFSTDEMRENAKIKMITSIITGKSSNAAVDEVLDELLGTNAASVTSAQRNNIENALSNVNTYKNNIEACRNEITGLMDALDGQYITPGPTGDPIKKPDALPTGRNPYPMDPREIPTQAAYNMGVRLGNDLLKMYAEENQNASPEKVAFLLWAVEASRTGGINEGEIFYLLGVEPTWNTANNRINTQVFNVVSQNDLGRPRVDVVVEVSGSYRDTYAQQIAYINLAAKLASEQDEPDNPVRKNSLAILEILKADENLRAKYTDDELWDIACTRVFGPAPGEYTPGIENMAGTEYGSEANAAELYLARMSYMYVTFTSYEEGKTFKTEIWNFGEERSEDILKAHLKDVNMGVFSRSSEVYGLLDHPMVASYFGGLAAAINASGGNSDMYINNLRSGSNEVQTLSEFLITDLNSKYFNPKWIEGMMNSGYAGTSHMNEFFEVMSVWSMAMPDLITESMFKNMYETYINDDKNLDVSDYLKSTNPYAYQSMVGNLLNAIYNGDWQPSDEIRQQLEKDYVEQTALNGVVCCHHTCSNMKFNQNIVNGLTAIDLSDNIKQQYLQEVNMALNQNFSMRSNTSSSGSSRTSTPLNITNASENNTLNFSENSSVDGSGYGQDSDPAGTPEVSGYEMTVVDITTSSLRDFLSHPTVSVSNALLIIFVVFITGAIFYGFKKRSL